tara:strand:- start:263 stop:472 length:210 start_codon:yes stop_codon:yes gene_type:complete
MSYYIELNEAIKLKNKMDIYTQSKIKGLEDHVKHQDKIIKGWIEVAKVKDEIIENYRKQLEGKVKQYLR